ncbi:MAG: TIGR02206 family membrane protein [Bacteroidetes bacterium]|nr:TIGR02206 family membrane protein [Bacteroidota bacterium]MCY4204107.1 TIGR02206 family membrane protein [Bacteroidota bacterium]
MSFFFAQTSGIEFFEFQHFMIISIMIIVCVFLPLIARMRFGPDLKLWISRGISILVSACVVGAISFRWLTGSFDWHEDLPFDLCNLFGLLLPILFWRNPPKRMIEILYYLILGGTLQGVLTPDIDQPFPHLLFMTYWIVHCGLVIHIIYVIVVWRIYPRIIGVINSLLFVNAYALIIFIFNYFAGSNYLYLMEKPRAGSLLDFLGPWPWYILSAEFLGLLIFCLAWLPFARFNSSK